MDSHKKVAVFVLLGQSNAVGHDVPMDEASRKRLREYIKSKEGKEQLRRMLSTLSEVPGIDAEEADKNEDA